MKYFFPIIVLSLLTIACNKHLNIIKDSDALVKVGNKTLYRSDVEENIATGLTQEDSVIAAEHYVRSWINNNLLYNIAQKNFNDKEKIDRLVENYRRSLLINQYQEQLVGEKLTNEIDEQSLQDYYNQNKDKFKLERPLVKGLFLKVPVNAPQLNEIRTWYKSTAPVSRENLEKYSTNNAAIFNYFIDKWTDFNETMSDFPKELLTKDDLIAQRKTIEKQDDKYFYFLKIIDCLLRGDNAPYEYVKPTVRELLLNQQKIDFLKKTEDDLYQRAVDKGEIKFYNDEAN